MITALLFGTIFVALLSRKNRKDPVSGIIPVNNEYFSISVRNYSSEDSIESKIYYFRKLERDEAIKFWIDLQHQIRKLGFIPHKDNNKVVKIYWRGEEHITISAKVIKK